MAIFRDFLILAQKGPFFVDNSVNNQIIIFLNAFGLKNTLDM